MVFPRIVTTMYSFPPTSASGLHRRRPLVIPWLRITRNMWYFHLLQQMRVPCSQMTVKCIRTTFNKQICEHMVIVMLTCLLLLPSATSAIHQRISTAQMNGTFCTGNGVILEAYTKSSPWILSGEVL